MKNYLLTMRFDFEAEDDVDAREKTKSFMSTINVREISKNGRVNLQEVFTNKAPRNIKIINSQNKSN